MEKKYIVGIDLGGTKIAGALSDKNGNILYMKTIETLAAEGSDNVMARIIWLINHVLSEHNISKNDVIGIGIASPGPLNSEEGIIIETPNLPFKNFPLKSAVENATGIKTFIDNDANAAALGEFLFGAGKGVENLIYITVSTGIGGGIIINKKLYRGKTGNAGELGHMTVEPHGPRCNCGNYGCLEVMASGTAIARVAGERLQRFEKYYGEKSLLLSYENISSKEVFECASRGDKLALEVVDYTSNYLGIGIASFINIFDPEMIVIGGGVSKVGDMLFDRIRKIALERSFDVMSSTVKIVPASLGSDAGLVGALAIISERLL
jgi:glucokinase